MANKSPRPLAAHELIVNGGIDKRHAVLITALAGHVTMADALGVAEQTFVLGEVLDGRLKSVDRASGELRKQW